MSRTIRNFNFTIIPPSCFTTLSSPFSFMLYYMLIYIYWLDFSYLVKFPHEAPHNPKSLFVLILLPCEFCIMLIMHDEYMPTKLQLQFWHHLLSPRFFKKASGILQSPPSVRPSVRLSVRPSVHPSVRHAISS